MVADIGSCGIHSYIVATAVVLVALVVVTILLFLVVTHTIIVKCTRFTNQ